MSSVAATIAQIRPADEQWRARARARLEQLVMPFWALGRLMDVGVELAGIRRSLSPSVRRRMVVVMAGDHGVTEEGVSAYPAAVTGLMIRSFIREVAGVNVLSRQAGAEVMVVDVGVAADLDDVPESPTFRRRRIAPGTRNMLRGPAMTRQEAEQSMEIGVDTALELIDGGMDLLATGEMGIGNTTPSSAIVSVLCGAEPGEVTGCGTGVSEPQRRHKADVVKGAVALHHPNPDDPLGVLAAVGGFEIGALAGLILGAAARRRPILVDGFVCTAAALVSQALCPAAADYTFAGHRSVERGHTAALRRLGKTPLLDLNLRLGEGTGAVLAMYILEAATRVLTQVATFEEAGIPRTSS